MLGKHLYESKKNMSDKNPLMKVILHVVFPIDVSRRSKLEEKTSKSMISHKQYSI